jgi:ADP-heptose:LPS heptosyltransferase
VVSLPAVAALRTAYPRAHLMMMVRPRTAPLAQMVVGVDEVLELPDRRRKLLSMLRKARPDLVVCISRGASIAWAAARARVPHRVGAGHRYYSRLFDRRVNEHRRSGRRHEVEYALSFAHRAGSPNHPPLFPLQVPNEASAAVDEWLRGHAIRTGQETWAVLHPGSGGSCPAWPIESWLDLAVRLLEAGHRVVISVGPDDAGIAAAIDSAAPEIRRIPLFTGGVQQLAALGHRAGVVASNSTGPLHLAAALGTPTLGFYAPWATCGVGRWGPYADNGWALVAGCDEALAWSHGRRERQAPSLMKAVSPELAACCVVDLLEGRTPRYSSTGGS